MNIFITQRHEQNKYEKWIDSLENDYIVYFEQFGVNLIPLSNVFSSVKKQLNHSDFSGIILSGGGDVNPGLYGQKPDIAVNFSPKRDALETELIKFAMEKKIPLLGICRGMQFINVYFGGKLIQNLTEIDRDRKHQPPCRHNVKIQSAEIYETLNQDKFETNSYHNQAITPDKLAKDLEFFAIAEDAPIIEGFNHRQYPIAGIQWHPERPGSDLKLDEFLISSFLNNKLFWG